MQNTDLREINHRLTELRFELLRDRPFYGRLLLHLSFGFAACGTAYTDMRHIVFDPDFASTLSDEELKFILLHELMHCVLRHCTRGQTLQPLLYNIACDIVVNSLILDEMGCTDFYVAGEPVMHLTPKRTEGRNHNAEEVYRMLLQTAENTIQKLYGLSGLDNHDAWKGLIDAGFSDAWGQFVREAASAMGSSSGVPLGLQRHLGDIYHSPKTNWRQLLQEFIRHDRSDFTYLSPDHRYQGEMLFPSFQEQMYGDRVDRLWFLIDTSASISEDLLIAAYSEIYGAVQQIENLTGELSFFDTEVTEPIPFESVDDLQRIKPVGGGGTNFHAIFHFLANSFADEPPQEIIILTDGCAPFPKEEAALDVPVLWIIMDSETEAPWGVCVHLSSE